MPACLLAGSVIPAGSSHYHPLSIPPQRAMSIPGSPVRHSIGPSPRRLGPLRLDHNKENMAGELDFSLLPGSPATKSTGLDAPQIGACSPSRAQEARLRKLDQLLTRAEEHVSTPSKGTPTSRARHTPRATGVKPFSPMNDSDSDEPESEDEGEYYHATRRAPVAAASPRLPPMVRQPSLAWGGAFGPPASTIPAAQAQGGAKTARAATVIVVGSSAAQDDHDGGDDGWGSRSAVPAAPQPQTPKSSSTNEPNAAVPELSPIQPASAQAELTGLATPGMASKTFCYHVDTPAPFGNQPRLPTLGNRLSACREEDEGTASGNQSVLSQFSARMTAEELATLDPDMSVIPYSTNSETVPAICTAAAKGDVAEVALFVQENPRNLRARDDEGRTALMYAVHCHRMDCVQHLIGAGSDLNAQAIDGSTALHNAAFRGSDALIELLTQSGASHLVRDNENRLPLHWATHNNNIKCLSYLMKKVGAVDLDVSDGAGMTCAMWAAFYNNRDHLTKLARNGANLELQDVEGKSALHWAVCTRSIKCLKELLTPRRAQTTDKKGRTVLHCAAETGNKKGVKHILSQNPELLDVKDGNGRTALHWAAVLGNWEALGALLKRGADPTLKDEDQRTALEYSIHKGHSECEDLLREAFGVWMRHKSNGMRPQTAVSGSASKALSEQLNQVVALNTMPSEAIVELFQLLAAGMFLEKYTDQGKGTLHRRYFWVDCGTGEVCWTKTPNDFVRDPRNASNTALRAVEEGPSATVSARKDFSLSGKHAHAFTVVGGTRQLDLIAPSQEVQRLWVTGLKCLLAFGPMLLDSAGNSGIMSSGSNDPSSRQLHAAPETSC